MRANVEKLHAENPQGGAVIQADREAETGVLVEIMDQVRLAGSAPFRLRRKKNKAGTGDGNDRIFQNDGRCAVGRGGYDWPVSHHESAGDGQEYEIEEELASIGMTLCVSSATKKARPKTVRSNAQQG